MLCFFCDSINHYSENCNIHPSDKSRKIIAQSKNCCEYCLTPLKISHEDFDSKNSIQETCLLAHNHTLSCSNKYAVEIFGTKNKCSEKCCHFCLSGIDATHKAYWSQYKDHQKCFTCFSTKHHTVYCPIRVSDTSNLFLPKIDADLFQRFLKMFTAYEHYLIALASPQSQNIWTITNLKPIRTKWFLKVEKNIFEQGHTNYTFVITSELKLIEIQPFLIQTLLDTVIIKTHTVSISNMEMFCHDFFQMISSRTTALNCINLTLNPKINVLKVLEKIPNILTLKMVNTNLVMDELLLENLFKCKDLSNFSITMEMNKFDPAKLAELIEANPHKCIHFTFYIIIPITDSLAYNYARNTLEENILQHFTKTKQSPEDSCEINILTKQHTNNNSLGYSSVGTFVLPRHQTTASKIAAAFTRVKKVASDITDESTAAKYRRNKFM